MLHLQDYGIDFEDHDHPTKVFSCHCGSKFCRNIRRSSKFITGQRIEFSFFKLHLYTFLF